MYDDDWAFTSMDAKIGSRITSNHRQIGVNIVGLLERF